MAEIKHDFVCAICGRTTHLFQDERDTSRAITYPMSEAWEKKNGRVNVALKLDCGHYMLDDKEDNSKVPDYVEVLE